MKYAMLLGLLVGTFAAGCQRTPEGTTPAGAQDDVEVYFSPHTDCRALVVDEIRKAEKRIWVQAYSFTSDKIAKALVEAHQRGVEVKVIIDADKADKKSETAFLSRKEIDTYVDSEHQKAHNKVILIDGRTIISGSFNFTDEDEASRADNVLVIRDKSNLTAAYAKNFTEHLGHSTRAD